MSEQVNRRYKHTGAMPSPSRKNMERMRKFYDRSVNMVAGVVSGYISEDCIMHLQMLPSWVDEVKEVQLNAAQALVTFFNVTGHMPRPFGREFPLFAFYQRMTRRWYGEEHGVVFDETYTTLNEIPDWTSYSEYYTQLEQAKELLHVFHLSE